MPLAESFSNSIKEESFSCLAEIAEAALDSITNDGFVTNVPLISTVVSLYKISNSIRERAYLKKLAVFIDEFNRGIVDEEERCKKSSKTYNFPPENIQAVRHKVYKANA